MPKLNLICAHHMGMVPVDDDGRAFLQKHMGKTVTAELKVQRSPQHNSMFWAVAQKTHDNLPDHYARAWPTKRDMVKSLQLVYGFTDKIMKPVKGGTWEVIQEPKSLDFSNMEQDEFNLVSEKLFEGMARCLSVTVDELLNETRAA